MKQMPQRAGGFSNSGQIGKSAQSLRTGSSRDLMHRSVAMGLWQAIATIAVAAQAHGCRPVRMGDESLRLGRVKGAALQCQAVLRGWRQGGLVAGLGSTQVALGGHMHAHRLGHRWPEANRQQVGADFLVAQIGGAVLGHHEMAEVVQQAGNDQRLRIAGLLGQLRALQRMLGLGNGLAAVEGDALRVLLKPQ